MRGRSGEDPRVVRDHAVDAGGNDPLELCGLVHGPHDHRDTERAKPRDGRPRREPVLQHQRGGARPADHPGQQARHDRARRGEPSTDERLQERPPRDAEAILGKREAEPDRRAVPGDRPQALDVGGGDDR